MIGLPKMVKSSIANYWIWLNETRGESILMTTIIHYSQYNDIKYGLTIEYN